MTKFIDDNALLYYDSKIKSRLDKKVDKVDGKGLSTEDYTTAEKTKLGNIEENAQVNVIEEIEINGTAFTVSNKKATATIEAGKIDTIKVNGTAQTIDANKAVDITVPTKVSDLTNDSKFQTESEVNSAITTAIGGIANIDYKILGTGEYDPTTLKPTVTGAKGIFYFVPKSTSKTNNVYIEWVYTNNDFEIIGDTEVDLSNYWSKTDLVVITNAEIDTIVA